MSSQQTAQGEMAAVVRELQAELVGATATATRLRTLADVLLVELEQADRRHAASGGGAADLHKAGAWPDLLGRMVGADG